jgi:hypothetical protein
MWAEKEELNFSSSTFLALPHWTTYSTAANNCRQQQNWQPFALLNMDSLHYYHSDILIKHATNP